MKPENARLTEMMEQRLRGLKGLALEIQAAQQACVSADIEALRAHDSRKKRLCSEIRQLDNEIRSVLPPLKGSVRSLLEAFVANKDPEARQAAERLRNLLNESEAARAEVSKLNGTYAEFLARARSNLNVMINVLSHCRGIYYPPQMAASRNTSFERSC